MLNKVYDVIIIGGGFIGLFFVFYSGFCFMKIKIIDVEFVVGGKVCYFFLEKIICDIGGIFVIIGENFVVNLK